MLETMHYHNQKYYFLFLLVLCIGNWQCLDTIDLEVPPEELGGIIIQGKVIKGSTSRVELSINNVFDFTPQSRTPILVRSATVYESGGGSLELERTGLNTYSAIIQDDNSPSFPIKYGNSYWVSVTTLTNNTFNSEPEILYEAPKMEGLYYEILPDQFTGENRVSFKLTTSIIENNDGNKSKLRFLPERSYQVTDCNKLTCYVSNLSNVNDLLTIDGNKLSVDIIEDIEVYSAHINSLFAEGYYQHIYMESLSEETLIYWNQIATIVNRSGNMFDAPVGKHISNITAADSNPDAPVFGYFYATEIDTIRIYVDPVDMGSPTLTCPPAKPKQPQCLPCCGCLGLTGSTDQKPSFWTR